MKTQMQYTPAPFSFDSAAWGEVIWWEELLPGVYGVGTKREDGIYVVEREKSGSAVSEKALRYGVPYAGGRCVYFDYENARFVAEYEIFSALLKTCAEEDKIEIQREILEAAQYGAEHYSSYFGEWKPQPVTPWGKLTQALKVGNGVWFVQTGGKWRLSVCAVQYGGLGDEVVKTARGNPGEDPNWTSGDRYWELEECAPAIFDLLFISEEAPGLMDYISSPDDLCRCLCERFPGFVDWYNRHVDDDIAFRKVRTPDFDPSELQKRRITVKEGSETDFLKLPVL